MSLGKFARTALALVARASRVVERTGLLPKRDDSALLLPPAAPGNLGDDAMTSSTLATLRKNGVARLGILALDAADEWRKWHDDLEIVQLASRPWPLAKLKFLLALLRYRRFYCLGADMMDGYYQPSGPTHITELCALAALAGAEVTILGFSFNDGPTAGALSALHNLPKNVRLCVRDPISHARLSSHLDRAVDLVADAAFLLEPQTGTQTVADTSRWIDQHRERSRIVIGVNLNHRLYLRTDDDSLDDTIAKFSAALSALSSSHGRLSFLLIPHDYRPHKQHPGDAEIAAAVHRVLPRETRAHAMALTRPCRAAEVKAICGRLDLVVTGLMHLAIGSLGQGTPVGCFSYQGKFEGLLSHFGLGGLVTDPEAALEGERLTRFVLPLLDARAEIRAKVQAELPRIRRLAAANFE